MSLRPCPCCQTFLPNSVVREWRPLACTNRGRIVVIRSRYVSDAARALRLPALATIVLKLRIGGSILAVLTGMAVAAMVAFFFLELWNDVRLRESIWIKRKPSISSAGRGLEAYGELDLLKRKS